MPWLPLQPLHLPLCALPQGQLRWQPVQPQPLEDLSGVGVCCGDYANCFRPCTPRGTWIAQLGTREAQPVQEPVGYTDGGGRAWAVKWSGILPPHLTLYAAPVQPAPLTDAEIEKLWDSVLIDRDRIYEIRIAFARAIEAAIKGGAT